MPRDVSGNYTLPSGVNPVVNNTLIDVAWANPTLSDIATQLNNVLTRDGLLGPILPLKLVDGTVGAPALCFGSQPTTGFYKTASGFGFGISGTNVISVDATAFQIPTSNLGLKQVLSAWGSGIGGVVQQVGGSLYSFNSSNISLVQNIYHDGTNARCVNTGYAASYLQNGGGHYFYTTAASTTAGSIPTLNTALTIDKNGNVGIGKTPGVKFDIQGINNNTAIGANGDLRVSSLNGSVSTVYGWNQLNSSSTYALALDGVSRIVFQATNGETDLNANSSYGSSFISGASTQTLSIPIGNTGISRGGGLVFLRGSDTSGQAWCKIYAIAVAQSGGLLTAPVAATLIASVGSTAVTVSFGSSNGNNNGYVTVTTSGAGANQTYISNFGF